MLRIVEEAQTGILKNSCEVCAVIANNEQAGGLALARDMQVPTFVVPSRGQPQEVFENDLLQVLKSLDVDYLVLAGFMKILSGSFVSHYKRRIVNIHPADTRQHKGLYAYQWAFERKLPSTKITVHYVDDGVDTGEIIAQTDLDLKGAASLGEVEERGIAVEHQFYSKVLRSVFSTQEGD